MLDRNHNLSGFRNEMVDVISSQSELAKFIADSCKEHWQQSRQALLLTTVGTEAKKRLDNKNLLRAYGGLKKFIESYIPEVKIISHRNASGKDGIVPSDADVPENTDFLFTPAGVSPTASPTIERRSYHSGFWKAFKEPLPTDKKRIWDAATPQKYVDVADSETTPTAAFEIPRKYILGIEGAVYGAEARKINDTIAAYLSDNALEAHRFVNKQEQFTSKKGEFRQGSAVHGNDSDIIAAFLRLSRSEQARITVPLDIVVELLRSR
jgi:hypothetical protein